MRKRVLGLVFLTAGMLGAENRLWKWSLAAVAAGNAADMATSIGRYELNPVLGVGRFGPRAAGVKMGLSTAVIGMQYLMVRRKPEAARRLSYVNFAMAAATGGAAAYNRLQ